MSDTMTVKRAIDILNLYIERNKKMVETLENPAKSWNEKFDCMRDLSHEMADLAKSDIKVFESINKEMQPNCKHPKKMRDRTANGQWYCMNCNQDLE